MWPLHLPDRYPYQNSIEEDDFHKVLYALVECSLVREWFDVEVKFLSLSDYLSIQMYFESVRVLSTHPNELVHELKPVREHSL